MVKVWVLVNVILSTMITARRSIVSVRDLCHSCTFMPMVAKDSLAIIRYCMLYMSRVISLGHFNNLSGLNQMLVSFDFSSCQSKLLFKSFNAVMGLAFFTVDVNFLVTGFTEFYCFAALIFNVKFYIFLLQSQATPLRALNHSVAAAG